MTTRLLLALCLLAPAVFAQRVSREVLRSAELMMDRHMRGVMEDPVDLLGGARGVYLDGYGLVVTSEVELVVAMMPTPFRPELTKPQLAELKKKKQKRIEMLKGVMQTLLIDLAWDMKPLVMEDAIAVAVTIPYYRFEDTDGMPRQIVVSAPKKSLMLPRNHPLDTKIVRVQEYF